MSELTERQAKISDMLRQKKSVVSITYMAEAFDVAEQTIRRDVNALCDMGLVRRRHGGAETLLQSGNLERTLRQVLNRNAKINIANKVAKIVPDHSSVSLALGTTVEFVAKSLLQRNDLKLYTNSLVIAQTLSTNATFNINMSAGQIRNDTLDTVGGIAEDFFEQYNVDFGIIGVAGIDEKGNLVDFTEEEVRLRKTICENSRHTILVVDNLKFSRNAHIKGGKVSDIDTIICDSLPPKNILDMCKQTNTNFIIIK